MVFAFVLPLGQKYDLEKLQNPFVYTFELRLTFVLPSGRCKVSRRYLVLSMSHIPRVFDVLNKTDVRKLKSKVMISNKVYI